MKKAKIAAVAAAAVMAASAVGALAGCGGDPAHTINVFLLADAEEKNFYRTYFKDLEEQLEDEFGEKYQIKFDGQQEGDYYSMLQTKFTNGSDPDIFYLRPNELLEYKTNIVPLQSFFDENGAKYGVKLEDIYPAALNMYRFNPTTGNLGNPSDDLYAFPKDLSTQQLGYNSHLLKAYEGVITALDADSPTIQNADHPGKLKMPWDMDFEHENYTWTDYMNICKVIKDTPIPSTLNGYLPENKKVVYASDVPNLEVLVRSFGGELIDLSGGRANGQVNDITNPNGPIYKAMKYQVDLCANGADYEGATFTGFTNKNVCFYGEVGSWQASQYDRYIGAGEWGVMPWPTENGDVASWQGRLTSAGYVISTKCANSEKAEVAMRVAISFMSFTAQKSMAGTYKITIPMRTEMYEDYLNPENDGIYHPATRKYWMDVIDGSHGFTPAVYSTYNDAWLAELTDNLAFCYSDPSKFESNKIAGITLQTIQDAMQSMYDRYKDR